MGDKTLELLRTAMLRAAPLSEEEREAFLRYSAQLRRNLEAVDEALEAQGLPAPIEAAKKLRYLLEALPGITI